MKKMEIFVVVIILMISLLLPLLKVNINYSTFSVLGITIEPSKNYTIKYVLPISPNRKFLQSEIEMFNRKILNDIFCINNTENLKDIQTPSVKISEYFLNGSRVYSGSVNIDNAEFKFVKVEEKYRNPVDPKSDFSNLILACDFLNQNGDLFRANIYLESNGSVLTYSSLTIQDENDNIVAMFRWGKGKPQINGNNIVKESKLSKENEQIMQSTSSGTTFRVLKSYVKDIVIGNKYSNETRVVHALRTDAMADYPFATGLHVQNRLAIRSFGFNKVIADAYKGMYIDAGFNPSSIYVNVYCSNINDILEAKYDSIASCSTNEQYRYPQPSSYSTLPFSISFPLGSQTISYTINVPVSGVQKTWTYKHTVGSDPTTYNYAELNVQPFYNLWNESKLFWPDSDTNPYIINPGSQYGGFFARETFSNYGSPFYARFTTSFGYTISVGIPGFGTDYYYFSVYNTFDNVRLD